METSLETQMLARVRRHMALSFGGLVVCVLGFGAASMLGDAAFGAAVPSWFALVYVALLGSAAALGIWSTFSNLRCPACGGLVAFQVSANTSIGARHAQKSCRHCGKAIFGDQLPRQARRMGLTILLLVFGIASIGAVVALVHR